MESQFINIWYFFLSFAITISCRTKVTSNKKFSNCELAFQNRLIQTSIVTSSLNHWAWQYSIWTEMGRQTLHRGRGKIYNILHNVRFLSHCLIYWSCVKVSQRLVCCQLDIADSSAIATFIHLSFPFTVWLINAF